MGSRSQEYETLGVPTVWVTRSRAFTALYAIAKQVDGWKIVADQYTAIEPLPA